MDYRSLGMIRMEFSGTGFLMASPERALCDRLMEIPGLYRPNRQELNALLLDELRLEEEALIKLDLSLVEHLQAKANLQGFISCIHYSVNIGWTMNSAIQSMLQKYAPKSSDEYNHALREILQELALCGLWRAKFFEHALFYGGTALRVLHGLDRFSEDMDFSLLTPDERFELAPYGMAVTEELFS